MATSPKIVTNNDDVTHRLFHEGYETISRLDGHGNLVTDHYSVYKDLTTQERVYELSHTFTATRLTTRNVKMTKDTELDTYNEALKAIEKKSFKFHLSRVVITDWPIQSPLVVLLLIIKYK